MSMPVGFTPINQVRLTNVAYVKLNKKGKRFEIACYRNKVVNWRNRVESDINEVLQSSSVFSNVSKGMLASKSDMLDAFGTNDTILICKEILDKGEMQVSEQERQALQDVMLKDVSSIVAEKTINPEDGRQYTETIIQNAMKDIHYSVNLNKSAKQQALDVIRKLKKVMPIVRSSLLLRLSFPQYAYEEILGYLQQIPEITFFKQDTGDITRGDNSTSFIEVKVDPEHFRTIEEMLRSSTEGRGVVDILPQVFGTKEIDHNVAALVTKTEVTEVHEEADENEEDKGVVEHLQVPPPPKEYTLGSDDEEEVIGLVKPKKGKKKSNKTNKSSVLDREINSVTSNNEGVVDASVFSKVEMNDGTGNAKKEGKQGKKAKRIEKEKHLEQDARIIEREMKLASLQSASTDNEIQADKSESTGTPATVAGKCNTCGGVFATKDAYKDHFRSDWHRLNLKRKMKGFPLCPSEEEFYKHRIEYWDVDIITST